MSVDADQDVEGSVSPMTNECDKDHKSSVDNKFDRDCLSTDRDRLRGINPGAPETKSVEK